MSKCKKCGNELEELTENYDYCNNPNCELDNKGWDKVSEKTENENRTFESR